jgi:CheY-like chemotaxis protein
MEAIGQLAGGIAHDFNNMLAAIVGYADLIVNSFSKDNPKLARYATGIRDTGMRAADLTAKLLAFARKGRLEVVPVNMHEVVQAAVALFEHSLPKDITLTQHFAANPPMVIGDRTQLQNMVLNLAINAKDAMPNGGQLAIATENSIIDEEYAKSKPYHVVPGDYLKLSITDTGMGMDEKTKQRIFEPFFTTKEKGKGTGLGLASVYGTVKNHGGYIEVASGPGKGAAFRILLPLAGKQAERPALISAPLRKGTGGILLVDDDPEVRDMVSEVLVNLGYAVQVATNGKEAVDCFRAHAHEIDLVLLDMVMPVMGGYACFVELRKLNPAVRVLVSSGYASSDEAGRIMEEGGAGFLQKPYDMAKLSEAVANALSDLTDQTPGAAA